MRRQTCRRHLLTSPNHHGSFPFMHAPFANLTSTPALERAGFRFGPRGTQSSRTIMLRELTELFAALPSDVTRDDYVTAIVEENVLGKQTFATRKGSRQRLTEMYGLDPRLALFRVLRYLWRVDARGRPLFAMLCALARDPLLRKTALPVLRLAVGEELVRARFIDAIRDAVGSRMNEAVLDKVARNSASSWAQSGHLEGRVRKIRRQIVPTPGTAAMALWLGEMEGRAGLSLLDSDWAAVLDVRGDALLPMAFEAKRLGLIRARASGNVVEISTRLLDPGMRRW